MKLRIGQALVSAVDDTSVVVTRSGVEEALLTCGGVRMVTAGETVPGAEADPAQAAGTVLGKRYSDPAGRIEVLCTKSGTGTLALDGEPLGLLQAKPLPASD
ncbi:hypothetical protein EDD29_5096 [Actinocorallia herbida]|uniref:Uncharacterized protein n=1 Tax=Actinocorallia herbida TaxID=58109 RepID=A0A3N1D355_9ACTN|nr:hypothetical protein [Actinocorallia herbida]ROO87488.1 hypothetical protein EDD29_5096 [Actinocorallia herbida]